MMTHHPGYELHIQKGTDECSGLSVHVVFYNRALKQALLEFVRQEELFIKEVLLDDAYIRYEICCPRKQAKLVAEIERLLAAASLHLNEAPTMTALAVAQPTMRWMLA